MNRAILELPWTAPPLTLNARRASRGAMFAHARTVAEVRGTVHRLAQAAGLPRGLEHITVQLHYRPRDRGRRDTDNLIATAKPAYDALAAGRPARISAKGKPVPALVGYGMVPDDIPAHMSKPEPIIHEAERGKPGALWLEITWTCAHTGSVHSGDGLDWFCICGEHVMTLRPGEPEVSDR